MIKFLAIWTFVGFLSAGIIYGIVKDWPKPQAEAPHILKRVIQKCNDKWIFEPPTHICPKPQEII